MIQEDLRLEARIEINTSLAAQVSNLAKPVCFLWLRNGL